MTDKIVGKKLDRIIELLEEARKSSGFVKFPEVAVVNNSTPNSLLQVQRDVGPDEALAKVLCSAFWGGQVMPSADNADWTNVARAARKHIGHEVQIGNARALADMRVRAEKAEGRAERLQQRQSEAAQEAQRKAAQYESEFRKAAKEQMRAEKAEADLARVAEERDKWQAHHDALREGVYREYINARDVRDHRTQAVFGAILARDDERAEVTKPSTNTDSSVGSRTATPTGDAEVERLRTQMQRELDRVKGERWEADATGIVLKKENATLTAEVERLREGIKRTHEHLNSNSDITRALCECRALLNPPTEGEPDADT